MTSRASSMVDSARAHTMSRVAQSATLVVAGLAPRAMARTTRSRSVTMPRSTPSCTTGGTPMFAVCIFCAASTTVAEPSTVSTSGIMTSRTVRPLRPPVRLRRRASTGTSITEAAAANPKPRVKRGDVVIIMYLLTSAIRGAPRQRRGAAEHQGGLGGPSRPPHPIDPASVRPGGALLSEGEAAALLAEHDAVRVDLLDARALGHRVALHVLAAVDEDHPLR